MTTTPLIFFGTTNLDLCFNVERLPTPGESLIGSLVRHPGGKGANQAVAAARLGLKPKFFTRLGDDESGSVLLRSLTDAGVVTDAVQIAKGEASGSALVMVGDDGGNMIVIDPGANANVTPEVIDEVADRIEPGSIVVAEMGLPVPALERLFSLKDSLGFQLIFNPAPVRPGLPRDAWSKVDFVTPNESETFELTGIEVVCADSAAQAASALLKLGPTAVLITMGERGAFYADAKQSFLVPSFPVVVVDTTAAGDAFNGGFAAGLARGLTVRESVRQAMAVAALCVTKRGAQPSMPTAEAVDEFLNHRTLLEIR
ncbi:MAG: ribokinase [Mesorhizobium sp.]|uniref:ribokinase n=1 Tax=Mesorhizobium sp. TaxID=1871066 RepID=UPI000FE50184|nr:ribokinase [Mesorhizobium sp.]RWH94091.1 MAG: ribokinase [Mesorhizobium sp.]RWK82721.1 MAG: ribokinase [Mesorhizobium sp.]RWL06528.1 MAG: ribokinase [Mesorhizobium sp.]